MIQKQPLEESATSCLKNIIASEIAPTVASTPLQSSPGDKCESGKKSSKPKSASFSSSPFGSCEGKRRGRKPKRKLNLSFESTKGTELLKTDGATTGKGEGESQSSPESVSSGTSSDAPPKKKRFRSHDCNKYVQKTLTSYFKFTTPVKSVQTESS